MGVIRLVGCQCQEIERNPNQISVSRESNTFIQGEEICILQLNDNTLYTPPSHSAVSVEEMVVNDNISDISAEN